MMNSNHSPAETALAHGLKNLFRQSRFQLRLKHILRLLPLRGGISTKGKIAVILGIVIVLVVSYVNSMKKQEAKTNG